MSIESELRIVPVGRTGSGKSATGNTILGRRAFEARTAPSTVTVTCQKETAEVDGQRVFVIDTPGLFDTRITEQEVMEMLAESISLAAPGPHVFLVVIQLNRFTNEEQETVRILQEVFGEEAADYTMVLFTRGDDLEADGVSIEEFIGENEDLRGFIGQCHGGYHVFDNRNNNHSQVRELLQKINTMVQRNGGRCYTNAMFEAAERAIREEMQMHFQRENPNMEPEEARRRSERDNRFIRAVLVGVVAAAAAVAVAGVGLVGAAVGVEVLVRASAVSLRHRGCIVQ